MTYRVWPALLYYFPSDYRNQAPANQSPNLLSKGLRFDQQIAFASCPDSRFDEMASLFAAINGPCRPESGGGCGFCLYSPANDSTSRRKDSPR